MGWDTLCRIATCFDGVITMTYRSGEPDTAGEKSGCNGYVTSSTLFYQCDNGQATYTKSNHLPVESNGNDPSKNQVGSNDQSKKSGNCGSLGQTWYYESHGETSPGCFNDFYYSATFEDVNADGEFSTFIETLTMYTCSFNCGDAPNCCDL